MRLSRRHRPGTRHRATRRRVSRSTPDFRILWLEAARISRVAPERMEKRMVWYFHLLPYIEQAIRWVTGLLRGWGGWG